jgi:hypothetical protein
MNAPVIDLPIEVLEDSPQTQALPLVQPPSISQSVQQPVAEITGPMGSALQAMRAGVSVADMKDLLIMQREWEANEARKAFAADMAQFKLNPPDIVKDKHVYYEGNKGPVSYDHATIGEVCSKVIVAAAQYGFSHRWKTAQTNGQISVTCIITHRLGHAEETTLEAMPDQSGGKNAIQAIGSSSTYLSRYSLLMGYGFATKDMPDDDGRGAGGDGGSDSARTESKDVLQEWIRAAQATTTHEALTKVRNDGNAAFLAVRDAVSWELLKEAVKNHRATLPPVQPVGAAK